MLNVILQTVGLNCGCSHVYAGDVCSAEFGSGIVNELIPEDTNKSLQESTGRVLFCIKFASARRS